MAEIVRMPKLSDTMTDGVVAKWHKKVGDKVKSGELLAEIETDKATMDFESFFDGVILTIISNTGIIAPIIIIIVSRSKFFMFFYFNLVIIKFNSYCIVVPPTDVYPII